MPEHSSVRYLFYTITLGLAFLTVYSIYIFYKGIISMTTADVFSSVTISLFFSFAVFSYLMIRGKNIKGIIGDLGLSRDKLTLKNLGYGILLFLSVLLLSLAITLISQITSIQLPTNVQMVLAGTPIWFLVFTFLVAPINEEILFRGFLVPRVGIILSAIIFAILHLSYLSISEFVAAFFFGLVAGYLFKKKRSLYSTIFAHAFVNFLTVVSLIYVGMYIHI